MESNRADMESAPTVLTDMDMNGADMIGADMESNRADMESAPTVCVRCMRRWLCGIIIA
jgi:hypothetical protein